MLQIAYEVTRRAAFISISLSKNNNDDVISCNAVTLLCLASRNFYLRVVNDLIPRKNLMI